MPISFRYYDPIVQIVKDRITAERKEYYESRIHQAYIHYAEHGMYVKLAELLKSDESKSRENERDAGHDRRQSDQSTL